MDSLDKPKLNPGIGQGHPGADTTGRQLAAAAVLIPAPSANRPLLVRPSPGSVGQTHEIWSWDSSHL